MPVLRWHFYSQSRHTTLSSLCIMHGQVTINKMHSGRRWLFSSMLGQQHSHCTILFPCKPSVEFSGMAGSKWQLCLWMIAGWRGAQINPHLPRILGKCPPRRRTGSWEPQRGVVADGSCSCLLKFGSIAQRVFLGEVEILMPFVGCRALQINHLSLPLFPLTLQGVVPFRRLLEQGCMPLRAMRLLFVSPQMLL